ncbi:3643_t:CDS:2 [Ambispora leptoticha]|uniref:3643_t:CDS:1 n=1 Tax=Ambispora leptoticha TaxID=144679 RepID=A0A9N8Z9Z4_9GLOM|nr:3643_t:CDS:2 [Ambispora leptoticha]
MTSAITSDLENYTNVEKWDTETLVVFLKEQDLKLDDEDFAIIRNEKINGQDFLDMTEEKFQSYGLKGGPAMRLAKEVKALKDNTKRAYSSYRTLKDFKAVLAKYGIISGDITRIPQFTPVTFKIDEDNPAFKFCVEDILRRIKNMGPVVDTNEAMRCEYISTILHASVSLLEGLVISPQADIVGEENTGRVNYAIKKIINEMLEEIICITEGKQNQATMVSTGTDWYFILHTTDAIYCTSKTEYRISLTEAVLEDDTELRKSVKRILEVIVGLLKDRLSASDEPATKKRRVQEKISRAGMAKK